MDKQFVSIGWLSNFYKKEGVEIYNSLILSNNIVSDGLILFLEIEFKKGKMKFFTKQLRKRDLNN